ncbi:hypothetical protein SASPL_131986 [Salvia splendens]|uniref:Uncharacterized protein n=1 Tax=Salvia splendens TaxID=180675 RepID=A0A8X8ZLH6_SALSN|nr:hypothetical protein SASPL_131986 [Salvia splendens]
MDVWSWICELPNSDEWNHSESESHLTFTLASSAPSSKQSIHLRADRSLTSESDGSIRFSVRLVGFNKSSSDDDDQKPIWASDACPLSSENPFPAPPSTAPARAGFLDSGSHAPESFSRFFNLVLLTRLFWVCACDAPSDVGSFFFHYLLAPNIETFTCHHAPVVRNFFVVVGADVDLCLTRTAGYMLAKWLILRDVEVGLRSLTQPEALGNLGFSYAVESHGLWILKGYSPVKSMQCMHSQGQNGLFPTVMEAKESLLKYALAHQQLEAVIQLEYKVRFHESYIQVSARGEARVQEERRELPEREAFSFTGSGLGKLKVKAMVRMATRSKIKNWRWDQDNDGNAAVFDATLCDNTTGVEVAMWRPFGVGGGGEVEINFRRRYNGNGRAFTKSGGVVFAGDECGEEVGWRVSKEMEGSVCIEWCDEVDLPLIPRNSMVWRFPVRRWREEISTNVQLGESVASALNSSVTISALFQVWGEIVSHALQRSVTPSVARANWVS